ncbi:MAG: hypothetical protein ACXVIJ_02520 [Thermoanaerobaculia bacterium]
MLELAEACAVETYPWVDTSLSSSLVANFARVHILVSLFDGDPDKWINFIVRQGTVIERDTDLPFIEALRRRLRTEPLLVDELRRIVHEFSSIVAA